MNEDLWNWLEWISAVLAGTYTLLAAMEKRIGWVFAVVSSVMMGVVFWHRNIVGQAVLNLVYYVGVAVYGWITWGRDEVSIPITRRSARWHLIMIASGLFASGLVYLLLKHFKLSQSPAMDAWVTVFSVIATWMMARKVYENWAYWCLVDGVAITMYVTSDPPLHAYALLYAAYVALSAIGWWRWSRALPAAGRERTAADRPHV